MFCRWLIVSRALLLRTSLLESNVLNYKVPVLLVCIYLHISDIDLLVLWRGNKENNEKRDFVIKRNILFDYHQKLSLKAF